MSAKATRWNYGTVDLAIECGPISDLPSMLDPLGGNEVEELEDWIASRVLRGGKPSQTNNSEGTANTERSTVPESGHQN